jgi:hypothetical protein
MKSSRARTSWFLAVPELEFTLGLPKGRVEGHFPCNFTRFANFTYLTGFTGFTDLTGFTTLSYPPGQHHRSERQSEKESDHIRNSREDRA